MSAAVHPTEPLLPPWRQPVRGGHPDPALVELTGAEQLERQLAGGMPRPPLSHLTGLRLLDATAGHAEFRLPLTGWLRSPQGAISIGPLTIPADGAMACAVLSLLAPRTPFSTSELTLRLLRPARVGATVVARGRVIELRRTLALTDVEVRDESKELIAHGSALWHISAPVDARAAGSAMPAPAEPSADAVPDPYERSPQGEILPQEVWERCSGLEVLRAQLAGELPRPPIHHLTGLTVRAAEPGATTVTLPATQWLCAPPPGRVQGGMTATLAESALNTAIQTLLPAGTALAPIDLKINFLRPLASDGREAVAHGRVAHSGRRLAVATAEVLNADGKTVAIATGSAMLLPGRPAALAGPAA